MSIRRQVNVLCGWGVPHPRATARAGSEGREHGKGNRKVRLHPTPRATARPYKDTEQLILLRRLCKGGSGVVRSGDPCGRPGVGLWLLSLTPIARGKPTPLHECAGQDSVCMESESDVFDEG